MAVIPATESAYQRNVFTWASVRLNIWPELALMFHVPNGGDRHVAVAAKLKAEGVKAGVPDIWLPVPRIPFTGLVIEMKRPGGRVTKEQKWWLDQLAEQGWYVAVCDGQSPDLQAMELIKLYLTDTRTLMEAA